MLDQSFKLSVVVPCYNESATIKKILEMVLATNFNIELIVVDDGSVDDSCNVVESIEGIVLIRHPENRGKGAALATGFAAATGDIILIQDADLEYSPKDYDVLIEPLVIGEYDVVFGSRFMGSHGVYRFLPYFANKFLTLLTNILFDISFSDIETGYKVFLAPVAKSLTISEKRFGVEPEIAAQVAHSKLRIKEIPISYNPRSFEEGKKISWKDGVRAVYVLCKYRLLFWSPFRI